MDFHINFTGFIFVFQYLPENQNISSTEKCNICYVKIAKAAPICGPLRLRDGFKEGWKLLNRIL